MDASLILKTPRLKVQRAHRHIDDLRRVTTPLSREFYKLAVEVRAVPPYRDRREYALVYRPTQDIPEALALMMGDALHNLRGALDHLASKIIGNPRANAHFPVRRKREDLVTAAELDAIEKALPGSKSLLLDEIRPKDGPDEAAWAFASINNDDKHNDLVPTVAVTTVKLMEVRAPNGTLIQNLTAGFDATRPSALIAAPWPITPDNDLQATVDVRFGKGNPFENEPVVPTLLQVAEVVSETLDAFERLIRKRP